MMMGRVAVNPDLCKGCGLCLHVCPSGVFQLGSKMNDRGYRVMEPVQVDKCTGCAACALICPDVALTVWRMGKKESSEVG